MSSIDSMLAKVKGMTPEARADMNALVMESTGSLIWSPNPGPQRQAHRSRADLLLYGGAGGGGKSDLLAGLALTEHRHSLLVRPQYTDLGALIDRVVSITGTRDGLNSSPPAQYKYDGRVLDFGAASTMERAETWQGNPHDLLAFDEAALFHESIIRYMMGWNRLASSDLDEVSDQRVRTILASNPPLSAEGEWLIGMFRPWLDVTHPTPAKAGELRWYITDPDGKDLEVDDVTPVDIDGVKYVPKSRTFIPAMLQDNPFLIDSGYQATLDAMPEPLRSAIRDGNFMASREDSDWQVIPSDWVLQANERWREGKPDGVGMSSLGLDVARGGRDDTVFAPRWGAWFDELSIVPGRQTPDGTSVAVLAAGKLWEGAVIGIDSIGVGADAETSLKNAGLPYETLNGAERATAHTRDGEFGFFTKRSEMWWMLREALDPRFGYELALPPDPALQADLCSPTYEVRPGSPPKIYVEAKKEMMKRLGRSPDRGDAVVYAWNSGTMDAGNNDRSRKPSVLHTPNASSDYNERRH